MTNITRVEQDQGKITDLKIPMLIMEEEPELIVMEALNPAKQRQGTEEEIKDMLPKNINHSNRTKTSLEVDSLIGSQIVT